MLRAAAPTIDATLGSLLRLVPLALVAWFMVLRTGAHEYRPRDPGFLTWRLIAVLLVGGSTSFVLGNVLYFFALTNGGLGITIAGMQAGSVLGGLLLAILLLRERPRRGQWAGAGLIALGLVFVAIARTQTLADLWWLGLLFAAAAGSTYALANVCSRYVQAQRPLLFVTLAGSSLGGAVPLLLIVAGRAATGTQFALDPASLGAVLLAGLANAVALGTLAKALQLAPIASVNTINSSSVVFSYVASVAIFGESGSLPMVVGIGFVTAGIVVAQLRRRAPVPVPAGVAKAA